jgi:hypothetical protein
MSGDAARTVQALTDFETETVSSRRTVGKGALSVLLVLTDTAKTAVFPLMSSDFLTQGGGQVAGASGKAANRILAAHGVKSRLSEEGGRTNRGSIGLMHSYVACLNDLKMRGDLDLDAALLHWIGRTEALLAQKPFRAKLSDQNLSIRKLVAELIDQARAKQKTRPGSTFTGALMQHLVAAKLRRLLSKEAPAPHGISAADSSRRALGDFEIKDVILHVTTAPSAQLLEKCKDNLSNAKRPIVITLLKSVPHAQTLAEELGIESRVEVWAFEQFISTNAYEWGGFTEKSIRERARELIEAYNDIIDELDEEPSLKISIS